MASLFRPISVNLMALFFIITTFLLLSLPNAVTSIPTDEFQSMLSTLRYHNYNLFCNALTTSDLLNDVVLSSDSSFTIFAPSDSSLFALDNTSTASFYTKTLRYHIIPRRLSMSDLQRHPSGSSFSTLLPHRHIHVSRRQSPVSDVITVDGIDVVVPGLYYGRDVSVHGLGGILSLKLKIGSSHGLPPPPMLDSSAFPLRTDVDSLVFPPVPSFSPVSHTIPAPSPQLTAVPPHTIISPVPVDSPGNQDSSPAPRHAFLLVQPPAELIPEYENKAVPTLSLGATSAFSKGKARRKMSGRRHFSKRSEASPSLGVEVAAGEICAKNPPMNYEQDLGRWME